MINNSLPLCRDYWTRTSDLAPPRRVRYQLRQIPIIFKSAAKIVTSRHICKFMFPFFVLKCLIYMDSCRYRIKAFAFTHFF